ncbi:MAG: hypothetical protein JNM00_08490, partial [Flavobacteriales bacterium]|nr:hypothetical protein [Flavobacteriales bacterium]
RHLPMIYQPGLGTLDVLGGFSWHSRRIQFALAIQHPVVQNKNSFDPGEWIDTPAVNALLRTTGFNRKPDLVGRLMMAQPIGSANGKGSWVFNYGLVPIYHAGNDTFIDHEENEVEIAASSGLTLNLSLGLQRTGKHFWQLSIGAPVIARDVRPEGLPQAGLVMEWGL